MSPSLITKHYYLEPGNMTRYSLVFTQYQESEYGIEHCAVTWLRFGTGGYSLAWPKGTNLGAAYSIEKSHIGEADLAAILRDVQRRFPGSIGDLVGFEEYDENGLWRG